MWPAGYLDESSYTVHDEGYRRWVLYSLRVETLQSSDLRKMLDKLQVFVLQGLAFNNFRGSRAGRVCANDC